VAEPSLEGGVAWTGEAGATLVELLVAAIIGLAVLGGAAMLFAASYHAGPETTDRSFDIGQARVTMERIGREIRQATVIYPSPANELSMTTYRGGDTCGSTSQGFCRVIYTCTDGTCSRVEANLDGSLPGPSVEVVRGLSDSNPFSFGGDPANPSVVYLALSFPARGAGHAITLRDAVTPRIGRL
jgi:hypothetical protein